ncbi:hypothetical protein L1987_27799 [Smallanthus sonchifolius]|uniref:Uncharacterized protein n=1 Tax=Smallanthus sonchifolius TaxID=185202 RepID=A0ACB9IDG3_9ASTR|nr:hypothetical protein L1987_27799 [Smallanthus sonchifolius]
MGTGSSITCGCNSFIVDTKFEKPVPARSDTDKRIEALLEILIGERSFHFESVVSEASFATEYSEATMSSKIQRSGSHFALDDLDSILSVGAIVKQEDPTSVIAKPMIPNLHSKTSGKKRKTSDMDLEVFEGMDPVEAAKKGLDKMNADLEAVEKRASVAEGKIEDMKKIVTAKSKLMEKDHQEIIDLKKELEDFKSRIKIAEEASTKGFDVKAWDLEVWHRIMAGLTGEKVETSKAGEDAGGEGEKEVPQGHEGNDA